MAKISDLTYKNLELLADFSKELGAKRFWLVYGGFALDGLLEKLTRSHKDIDLLFFRKDLSTIKETLKNIGVETTEVSHPTETNLVYKIVSTDQEKIFTGHILDEVPDNNFEINFYSLPHQIFSKDLIVPQSVTLNKISYPVPTKQFLLTLKERENEFLNKIKTEKPDKYSKWAERHLLVKDDVKLLKKLKK